MDYTVHGILQARILEWVAFPFSRGSSQPRNWARVSCIAGGFFTNWAIREASLTTGPPENSPIHSFSGLYLITHLIRNGLFFKSEGYFFLKKLSITYMQKNTLIFIKVSSLMNFDNVCTCIATTQNKVENIPSCGFSQSIPTSTSQGQPLVLISSQTNFACSWMSHNQNHILESALLCLIFFFHSA